MRGKEGPKLFKKALHNIWMTPFDYDRMPFRLNNRPATFQRMMNHDFRGFIGDKCFVHIDGILKIGKTLNKHNKNLIDVFERTKQLGLKLEPSKCEYLRPELKYLGTFVTKVTFEETFIIKHIQTTPFSANQ